MTATVSRGARSALAALALAIALCPPASRAQGHQSTKDQELRALAQSYEELVVEREARRDENEDQSKKAENIIRLTEAEDQLLGKLDAADPSDRNTVLAIISNARFLLDHRNPIPLAEQVTGLESALLAADMGQFSTALNALGAATDPAATSARKKIKFAQQIVRADSPPIKCPDPRDDICARLYSLLALPQNGAGRFQALDSQHTKRSGVAYGSKDADPRKQNRQSVAQVVLAGPSLSLPLPKDVKYSVNSWRTKQVAAETIQALNELAPATDNAMSKAGDIIDILLKDRVVTAIFSKEAKLVNGVTAAPSEQDDDRAEDDDATPVTLEDAFSIGARRYLVLKVEGFLAGGYYVFELPTTGTKLSYWGTAANAGGISYAAGYLNDPKERLLFISTTETTGGFLTLWIVDPARRRTARMFDDEEAYHGTWYTADIDGTGERKLFIKRGTGDRRFEDCNQCPSRIQTLVFRYIPQSGTVRLLSNYVSWNDLGFGANRNLLGLGPEVIRGGLLPEIQSGFAKLSAMEVGDGKKIREEAERLIDAVARLQNSKAHAEAMAAAARVLSLLSGKPEFDGKRDVVVFAATIAAESNLELGNIQAASDLMKAVDPFSVTNPRLRLIATDLKIRVARASGGLSEHYAALRSLLDRAPEDPSSLARLSEYLLSVGNPTEALRVARIASDRRSANGDTWAIDLYTEAVAQTRLGQYSSAIASLTLLLRKLANSSESTLNAKALLTAGDIAIRTGNFDAAQHLLDASFAQMDATAWSEEGPSALLLYGRLLRSTGNVSASQRILETAARMVNRRGPLVASLYDELAATFDSLSQPQAAIGSAKTAFDAIIAQQTTVSEETHKLSFVSSNAEVAERFISRLLRQNTINVGEVVDALESWRAQVLRSLRGDNVKVLQPTKSPTVAISNIAKGNVAYVTFYLDQQKPVALIAENGKFRLVPLSVNLAALDKSRQTLLKHMDISQVEAREPIWRDQVPSELRVTLSDLHHKLIAPLRLSADTKIVVLVPDEQLYWLPWPALPSSKSIAGAATGTGDESAPSSSLFEEVTVLLTPSALLVDQLNEPTITERRFAAVGSAERFEPEAVKAALKDMYSAKSPPALPALSSARQEVGDVQRILGAKMSGTSIVVSADTQGTRQYSLSDVLQAIGSASIIHVAAHGIYNPNNPMASAIFLFPSHAEEVLRPAHLSATNLAAASLVSLSACQTGLSEIRRGGEAIGFVRGILVGGARRVLLTAWNVEDRPTQQFFRDFYTRLAEGSEFIQAYHAAVLATAKRYRHPFYWGGFVMYSSATR